MWSICIVCDFHPMRKSEKSNKKAKFTVILDFHICFFFGLDQIQASMKNETHQQKTPIQRIIHCVELGQVDFYRRHNNKYKINDKGMNRILCNTINSARCVQCAFLLSCFWLSKFDWRFCSCVWCRSIVAVFENPMKQRLHNDEFSSCSIKFTCSILFGIAFALPSSSSCCMHAFFFFFVCFGIVGIPVHFPFVLCVDELVNLSLVISTVYCRRRFRFTIYRIEFHSARNKVTRYRQYIGKMCRLSSMHAHTRRAHYFIFLSLFSLTPNL